MMSQLSICRMKTLATQPYFGLEGSEVTLNPFHPLNRFTSGRILRSNKSLKSKLAQLSTLNGRLVSIEK